MARLRGCSGPFQLTYTPARAADFRATDDIGEVEPVEAVLDQGVARGLQDGRATRAVRPPGRTVPGGAQVRILLRS